jgi:hypothetical protein
MNFMLRTHPSSSYGYFSTLTVGKKWPLKLEQESTTSKLWVESVCNRYRVQRDENLWTLTFRLICGEQADEESFPAVSMMTSQAVMCGGKHCYWAGLSERFGARRGSVFRADYYRKAKSVLIQTVCTYVPNNTVPQPPGTTDVQLDS